MKLDEIRKLIDASTPGPWKQIGDTVNTTNGNIVVNGLVANMQLSKNAAFIAAARQLLPKLLKVAEAAKACLAQLPEGITADVAIRWIYEVRHEYVKRALAELEALG